MTIKHNNLGTVNKNEVILSKEAQEGRTAKLTLTFSYQTCVGIRLSGASQYIYAVHANDWSTTTGKLLNELEPDKKKRLSAEDFAKTLSEAMSLFEHA